MPDRPRIAIPVPTFADLEYNRRCWQDYAQAVYLSGGEAVEIPLSLARTAAAELSRSCHGILLPGSPADVDPERYGQDPLGQCAPADPRREDVDLLLIEQAASRGVPLLAVCFGAQILNVSRGGTLLQDLTIMPVNHAAGPSVAVAHTVALEERSLLGSVVTGVALGQRSGDRRPGFLNVDVNSSHHQAVGIPGAGLQVTARCPQDGVVEALEDDRQPFLIAVQWHPERDFASNSVSQALFASFVAAAIDRS